MIEEGTMYSTWNKTDSVQPDYWSCWAYCKSKKLPHKYFTFISEDYPDTRYAGDCTCIQNTTYRRSTAQSGLFSGELQCPGKLTFRFMYNISKYYLIQKKFSLI